MTDDEVDSQVKTLLKQLESVVVENEGMDNMLHIIAMANMITNAICTAFIQNEDLVNAERFSKNELLARVAGLGHFIIKQVFDAELTSEKKMIEYYKSSLKNAGIQLDVKAFRSKEEALKHEKTIKKSDGVTIH